MLLARVTDNAEDTSDALAELAEVLSGNSQAQQALGMSGFPVLCTVLREEHGNVDVVRAVLDCLIAAMGTPQAPTDGRLVIALTAYI